MTPPPLGKLPLKASPKLPAKALPTALLNRLRGAILDQKAGRLEAAVAGYRAVLRQRPDLAEAANNLGVALRALGQPAAAAKAFQVALEARPDYAVAHGNLAACLAAANHHETALKHGIRAMLLEPDNPVHRQTLVRLLQPLRFTEATPTVVRAMETLLSAEDVEHQLLVPSALSLLRALPAVARALEGGIDRLPAAEVAKLLEVPLFRRLLDRAILADPEFEALLIELRRRALSAVGLDHDSDFVPLLTRQAEAFVGLACHNFESGYAAMETAEETAQLAKLKPRLQAQDRESLLVSALYRPLDRLLADLPTAEDVSGATQSFGTDLPPVFAPLLRRQIAEPLAERRLAAELPRLTTIEAAVSQAVRQQYEEHPYPRWQALRHRKAAPLGEVVTGLFPWLSAQDLSNAGSGPLEVLVAGCGTGKHAVEVATRFTDVQVLAVDLSLASLAYGCRRARDLGLANLRFAQADLLRLGDVSTRFDLIESVGVLHHLADPEAGLRVLIGLLRPGGLLRLGLYSRRGRAAIGLARAHLRAAGFAPEDAGLRAARAHILALPPTDPAAAVTRELDFYSLSGCRDLLFHVQERDYVLVEIAALLERLNLEFLGFEFPTDQATAAYGRRFPATAAANDLVKWAILEAEKPETFHHMYQFWCRPRGTDPAAAKTDQL